MAKIKYTYCKTCKTDVKGVIKVCKTCGKSDCLMVWEQEVPDAENTDIYKQLPAALRGLYTRAYNGDFAADVEWNRLIFNGDPRIDKFYDLAERIHYFKKLYEKGCAEAAYWVGELYKRGVERKFFTNSDVQPNRKLAYEWYCKATNGKYYPAYIALGKLVEDNHTFHFDERVSMDLNHAAHYYGCAKKYGVPGGAANYARLAAMGYKGLTDY